MKIEEDATNMDKNGKDNGYSFPFEFLFASNKEIPRKVADPSNNRIALVSTLVKEEKISVDLLFSFFRNNTTRISINKTDNRANQSESDPYFFHIEISIKYPKTSSISIVITTR